MKKAFSLFVLMTMLCLSTGAYAESPMRDNTPNSLDTLDTFSQQAPERKNPTGALPPPMPERPEQELYVAVAGEKQFTLYTQHAIFPLALDAIIEPQYPPYNIGGWKSHNKVVFPVVIDQAGEYAISLDYSKQDFDGSTAPLEVYAVQNLEDDAPNDARHCTATLPMTGNDWSTYTQMEVGTLELPKGKVFLVFADTKSIPGQYVMNLRAVTLSLQEK